MARFTRAIQTPGPVVDADDSESPTKSGDDEESVLLAIQYCRRESETMFPSYLKPISKHFRERRNRALVEIIAHLQADKRAPLDVLDIGGQIVFWLSIPLEARTKCKISLLNLPGAYDDLPASEAAEKENFTLLNGDARDLSRFPDAKFDLVVCNSVIEHVGNWTDMEDATREATRVGRHGWVQVPAFEFPVEQHFLLPFVHWLAPQTQVSILGALNSTYRNASYRDRQIGVQHVRPLKRRELKELLPDARISTEWLLFPKSHMAVW